MTDAGDWASPGSGLPENPRAAGPEPDAAAPAGRSEPAAADPAEQISAEIPLRPLGASEILDGAVAYVRRSPRAALGLAAIPTTVVQVIVTVAQYRLLGGQARTDITPNVLARSVGPAFVTFLGGLLLTAFVVLLLAGLLAPVAGRALLGRGTSFGQAWREARPAFWRLLGAAALVLGAVLLAAAVPLLPLIVAVVLHAGTTAEALTAVLGVPLAVPLMIACYVWLAPATPILVLERRGVLAALRRSTEIVRGRWWRTFGVLALAIVITVFVEFIALPVPFAVGQEIILATDRQPGGWLLVAVVALGGVGRIIAGTLVNPFNAGVIALIYADRRMRREAFDIELRTRPPADPADAWLPGPLTAAGSGPQPRVPRRPLMTAPPVPPYGAPPPPPYAAPPHGRPYGAPPPPGRRP